VILVELVGLVELVSLAIPVISVVMSEAGFTYIYEQNIKTAERIDPRE